MLAFCGAHKFAAFGCNILKCNRLHKRRIVSLRLNALFLNTIRKPTLLNTNTVSVNKHEFARISSCCHNLFMFFSTERPSHADDASVKNADGKRVTSSMKNTHRKNHQKKKKGLPFASNGQDLGHDSNSSHDPRDAASIKNWPVAEKTKKKDHQSRNKNNFTILIGGRNFNHSSEYLVQLFDKFCDVKSISIPDKEKYDSSPCLPGELRFGFVTFSNHESLMNILRKSQVTGTHGEIILIFGEKDRVKRNRLVSIEENRRTLITKCLPDDITIETIKEYFQSFGNIEFINLILTRDKFKVKRNLAFIVYKDIEDIQKIIVKNHSTFDENIIIDLVKDGTRIQDRQRSKMILLSGLKNDISKEDIIEYFSEYGKVYDAVLHEDNGILNGIGKVLFCNKEDAMSAADERWHEIGSSDVKAQLLGLSID